MGDDVDPEDPRPIGHYHVGRNAEWYYVDDDLTGTIALGPATDGGPGDDWVLTFSAATPDGDPDAAERGRTTASDRVTQTATPTRSVRRSGTMDSSRVSTGRQR